MTDERLDRSRPWTEAECLALGETSSRIELIDGGLGVSPGPNLPHQGMLHLLHEALLPGARDAQLKIFQGINVRVGPDRLLIPDLTVVSPGNRLATVVEATAKHGNTLFSAEPFSIEVNTNELVTF